MMDPSLKRKLDIMLDEGKDNEWSYPDSEMRAKIAVVSGVAAVVANLGLLKKPRDIRAPNQVRDRLSVKAKVLSMNPRLLLSDQLAQNKPGAKAHIV